MDLGSRWQISASKVKVFMARPSTHELKLSQNNNNNNNEAIFSFKFLTYFVPEVRKGN